MYDRFPSAAYDAWKTASPYDESDREWDAWVAKNGPHVEYVIEQLELIEASYREEIDAGKSNRLRDAIKLLGEFT